MINREMKSDINRAAHKMANDVYDIFKVELAEELEKALDTEEVTFQIIIDRILKRHCFDV